MRNPPPTLHGLEARLEVVEDFVKDLWRRESTRAELPRWRRAWRVLIGKE